MAYLRRTKIGGVSYIYIMQSVRKGRKVGSRILEYLGREDRVDPARLRKAVEYWAVTTRVNRRKGRKGGRGR